MTPKPKLTTLDRMIVSLSPAWGYKRIRARAAADVMARHYEAADPGRRTAQWVRSASDANAATLPALHWLRAHARDLVRNNSWATNGLRTIRSNTVGWGITPKPVDARDPAKVMQLWRRWAGTTECDADGRLNFYGLQSLAMAAIARDGEVLLRRRPRRVTDNLSIPMQLQVLEADFIDTTKHGIWGVDGGPIIQGVEFDKLGRRVAYWLWKRHPGANYMTVGQFGSQRIDASEITHVFAMERPGQVRGVSWYAPAIVNLKDLDEYEDATLMRQKIAALFAAFVTDPDGNGPAAVADTSGNAATQGFGMLEPGMVVDLPPGKEITFANPPGLPEGGFTERELRKIAAGLGVTYEDLTGDYSKVNFSSARMSRIKHWSHVYDWRHLMLIPQLCDPVWAWAMEAATIAGEVDEPPTAEWTAPPMPMIEPDKEGLALQRLVRAGAMTPSEMVREQGGDPETHWAEYASDLEELDELGIVLDSDARKTSQAGLAQVKASDSVETAAGVDEKDAGEGDGKAADKE